MTKLQHRALRVRGSERSLDAILARHKTDPDTRFHPLPESNGPRGLCMSSDLGSGGFFLLAAQLDDGRLTLAANLELVGKGPCVIGLLDPDRKLSGISEDQLHGSIRLSAGPASRINDADIVSYVSSLLVSARALDRFIAEHGNELAMYGFLNDDASLTGGRVYNDPGTAILRDLADTPVLVEPIRAIRLPDEDTPAIPLAKVRAAIIRFYPLGGSISFGEPGKAPYRKDPRLQEIRDSVADYPGKVLEPEGLRWD